MVHNLLLTYIFSDSSTGEVIKEYKEHSCVPPQPNDDITSDIFKFLDNSRLVSMISSFRRGCSKQSSLSLTIKFDNETIF